MTSEDGPGINTQMGELREEHDALAERHAELTRRFDSQDRAIAGLEARSRRNGGMIESQGQELLLNTQATRRVEKKLDDTVAKTKDIVEVTEYAKKTFALVEWVVKRLLPLLVALGALIGGIGFWRN